MEMRHHGGTESSGENGAQLLGAGPRMTIIESEGDSDDAWISPHFRGPRKPNKRWRR